MAALGLLKKVAERGPLGGVLQDALEWVCDSLCNSDTALRLQSSIGEYEYCLSTITEPDNDFLSLTIPLGLAVPDGGL